MKSRSIFYLSKKLIKKMIFWRLFLRTQIVWGYYKESISLGFQWIFSQTEIDNFYYDLKAANVFDLECMVSTVTNTPLPQVRVFMAEILNNQEINEIIQNHWKNNPKMRDARVGLGRRIGWYCTIRASKPTLVVETGVSHGVGTLVICAALEKNKLEGFPGEYLGTDINPNAGELFATKFHSLGKIIIGDSLTTLRTLVQPISIFINDSDHSFNYEKNEYETVSKFLTDKSIILGDNSHVSSALREFALSSGRQYLFFKEAPELHWYPGAGIGFAFKE